MLLYIYIYTSVIDWFSIQKKDGRLREAGSKAGVLPLSEDKQLLLLLVLMLVEVVVVFLMLVMLVLFSLSVHTYKHATVPCLHAGLYGSIFMYI